MSLYLWYISITNVFFLFAILKIVLSLVVLIIIIPLNNNVIIPLVIKLEIIISEIKD